MSIIFFISMLIGNMFYYFIHVTTGEIRASITVMVCYLAGIGIVLLILNGVTLLRKK